MRGTSGLMFRMSRVFTISALVWAVTIGLTAGQQPQPPRPNTQQPARDTSARPQDVVPTPKGRITGRVFAGDSGRAVKRARVSIAAAELPGGRGVLTDDAGVFDFTELPAGR